MTYNKITRGTSIESLWDIPQDDGSIIQEWKSGVIQKVHRYDDKREYVVCTLKCEDGTIDKSSIFREDEFGQYWRFAPVSTKKREDIRQSKNYHIITISYIILLMNVVILYNIIGDKIHDTYEIIGKRFLNMQ
jgi:hypothetical protein